LSGFPSSDSNSRWHSDEKGNCEIVDMSTLPRWLPLDVNGGRGAGSEPLLSPTVRAAARTQSYPLSARFCIAFSLTASAMLFLQEIFKVLVYTCVLELTIMLGSMKKSAKGRDGLERGRTFAETASVRIRSSSLPSVPLILAVISPAIRCLRRSFRRINRRFRV
jgi:hypothetical protein